MLAVVCVLLTLPGADPKKDELAKKDLEKLQGTWKLMSVEWRGEKIDLEGKAPDSFNVTISGDKITFGKYEAALVLDPTTDPKLIDMNYTEPKKVTHEGIYRIDGDTLTMCWRRGIGEAKDRPTAFKTDDKTEYEVRTYKREKPKK